MRAISSFLAMVSTLGAIGWLNAAPSSEVGSDATDSFARTRCKPEMAHRDPTAWLRSESYANVSLFSACLSAGTGIFC
jgi:hypothetical protein